MLRAITAFTTVLALAGAALAVPAQAEDQIAVSLAGKSPQVVRADLYRAALTVCQSSADVFNPDVDTCLNESLNKAMEQFRHIQRLQATSYIVPQTR